MASPEKLKLKLFIDKKNRRVLFAESDKDFVDILLSFLTMPIGAIIRILNKQSLLGRMDMLYESIENLHDKYFNTEACKTMLLNPLNAYRQHCEDLVLRIDDSNPRKFYVCRKNECRVESFPYFSSVPKARCCCGEIMDFGCYWGKVERKGPHGDGVFVKGMVTFLITDDLHIMPASTMSILSVFENLKMKDCGNIEEATIDLDVDKLCDLLIRSLLSKHPLSDMYFPEPTIIDDVELQSNFRTVPKFVEDSTRELKKFKARFLFCKSSNKVVYAEAGGEGFVDLLLSFLILPLGSVVKLMDGFSSVGCVDNLYNSVDSLSASNGCLRSEECKSILLDPKVAPYFGCSNSLLPYIKQSAGRKGLFPGCVSCFTSKTYSPGAVECHMHRVKQVKLSEMNPKLQASKEVGGGYAKKEVKFIVTDELEVMPFSPLSSIQIVRKHNVNLSDLEEKEIDIGEHEALDLLKSCMTSPNPLSNVFVPNKQRKRLRTA